MTLHNRQLSQGTITTRSEPRPSGSTVATLTLTGDAPAGAILTAECRVGGRWVPVASGPSPLTFAPHGDRVRGAVDLPRPASVGAMIEFGSSAQGFGS